MNTAEKIYQEVRSLSDLQAQEVLDFIEFLKSSAVKQKKTDISEFNQFGAVFDGEFNRDECYDRKIFR